MFVCIFVSFGLFMLLCVSLGPTQYIFHTPVARYSLHMLKVLLNTTQTNKTNSENRLYKKLMAIVNLIVPD